MFIRKLTKKKILYHSLNILKMISLVLRSSSQYRKIRLRIPSYILHRFPKLPHFKTSACFNFPYPNSSIQWTLTRNSIKEDPNQNNCFSLVNKNNQISTLIILTWGNPLTIGFSWNGHYRILMTSKFKIACSRIRSKIFPVWQLRFQRFRININLKHGSYEKKKEKINLFE